jgi:hypothetical protein
MHPSEESVSATVVDAITPACPNRPTNTDGTASSQLKPAWQQMLVVAGGLDALGWGPVEQCEDTQVTVP